MKSKTPILIVFLALGIGVFFIANKKQNQTSSSVDSKHIIDQKNLIPEVTTVLTDSIFDGPNIDQQWDLPEGISLRLKSEDVGQRVRGVNVIVTSPGKESDVSFVRAQSEPEKIIFFRKSNHISGVFVVDVTHWIDFNSGNHSATGLKVKCTFRLKKETDLPTKTTH